MVTRSLCLLLLLTVSAVAQRIPPPESVNRNGLVGRWLVSGFNTHNAAATGNVASNVGAVTFATDLRTSAQFSGSNYLVVPDYEGIDVKSNITLTAWLQTTARQQAYFGGRDPSNKPGYTFFQAGNKLQFTYFGYFDAQSTTLTLPSGWFHAAITYDKSLVRYFVNGVLVSQTAQTQYSQTRHTIPRTIGGTWHNGPTVLFIGKISDIRVYKRALSADEITRIYRGLQ
jgi:hypothetical protein